jgi:hypothetical protein
VSSFRFVETHGTSRDSLVAGLASLTCATCSFDSGQSNLTCLTARTYPPSSNDGVSVTPDSTTILSQSLVLSQLGRVRPFFVLAYPPPLGVCCVLLHAYLHSRGCVGTLLNRLFGTTFDVMDETKRQQTTKGKFVLGPVSDTRF